MTRSEFLDLMAGYGADFSRWPDERREEAQAFLAQADADTRHAYESENAFDDFLAAGVGDPVVPIRLEEQILAAAPAPGSTRRRHRWFSGWGRLKTPHWATAGLLGVSLIGGVGAGYASTVSEADAMAEASMVVFTVSAESGALGDWPLVEGEE